MTNEQTRAGLSAQGKRRIIFLWKSIAYHANTVFAWDNTEICWRNRYHAMPKPGSYNHKETKKLNGRIGLESWLCFKSAKSAMEHESWLRPQRFLEAINFPNAKVHNCHFCFMLQKAKNNTGESLGIFHCFIWITNVINVGGTTGRGNRTAIWIATFCLKDLWYAYHVYNFGWKTAWTNSFSNFWIV